MMFWYIEHCSVECNRIMERFLKIDLEGGLLVEKSSQQCW